MHTVLAYLDGSWTLLISTLIFGALVGSFLNVVIVRLPSGASIAWPPSHCPNCKAFIRPYNNIPVLSWVLLRGQCANCQQAIDLRYPVVETVTACLFAGCASRFG
ncbi:MAG: prepilin peptidase, partial [Myxococcales bacterium]|nr:prepilin peptidase [Myxococcales bacterium]